MKNLSKILKYLVPYWYPAALNIVFNLLSTFFSLSSITMLIPFLGILFGTQPLVNQIQPLSFSFESFKDHFYFFVSEFIRNQGHKKTLIVVSLLIIVSGLFRNIFHYLAMYYLAPIRTGIVRDLRNALYKKVLYLPLSFYSEERKGDLMARITTDVQEIEMSIVSSIEMVFRDPITIIIYLIALFLISPHLTLFVIILLPISGYLIGRLGHSLRKASRRGQKKMGGLHSIIEETLGGLRVIKAFSAEKKVLKQFVDTNNLYTRFMTKTFRRRAAAYPLSEFLGIIVMVIIMFYGASLVLNHKGGLSPSEFIGYLALFYLVIEPGKSFSQAWYNIQRGMASADRVNSILSAEEKIVDKPDAKEIKSFNQNIEYQNVSFCYDIHPDFQVLKNVSFTLEKGKTIALVGQSGSGKTTIADLLPRFYDIREGNGDILIDGISLKDYKIEDIRSLIGYVNQEPILFNDNIFNNIAFGCKNVTTAGVENAAKVANAHDFIMAAKHGYQTNIGDRGVKLSGGQRQRLSIARAVLKNPPILILDEATSSLDTESERLVQDALSKLMQNRTTLVIAHRLSTIQHADEICVLHEGQIVERGTHNDLIVLDGYYKRLTEMQTFAE
jgi:subfamily B ATP-binding cassette protein MsbA